MRPVKWDELCIFVTYKCNLSCAHCLSGVGKFTSTDDEMTLDQIERALQQVSDEKWHLTKLFLTGGEPTLYPRLVEAVQLARRYRRNYQIFIQSNGVSVDPALRKAIFGTGKWGVCGTEIEGLDKTTDWIIDTRKFAGIPAHKTMYDAPIDAPELAEYNFSTGCEILSTCPITVNKYGFYACPMLATIDKAIGLDIGAKYLRDLKVQTPIQLREMCKYCGDFKFYTGLPFKESLKWSMSPSWVEIKRKYDENPPQLTVF